MNLDFPIFNPDDGMLPPLDLLSEDWRSFASTLVEEVEEEQNQSQCQQQQQSSLSGSHFPLTWEDLGQFQGSCQR